MNVKCDIVFAGVGGQGGLSVASVIAAAAMASGLEVKQNEIHGMSQRGGAVVAMLRMSDQPIASDLIPLAGASLILSMEPLESLRYMPYLAKDGKIITATTPVKNIADYPTIEGFLDRLRANARVELIEADQIARDLGAMRAVNMIMAGAASKVLPLKTEALEKAIEKIFARKGPDVVAMNIQAFRKGREYHA